MPPITPLRTFFWTADRLALAGLLVFTLFVRGGVLWAMRANLQQDPDAYREIAENLLRYGEFALRKLGQDDVVTRPVPTAYRPPLYPVLLSNLPAGDDDRVSLAKVAALHLGLGVASVWLTWSTARRIFACSSGPDARQEIALTLRSWIANNDEGTKRSEGPTDGKAEMGAGPPALATGIKSVSQTPASRPGLLLAGPPGLDVAAVVAGLVVACDPILLNQQALVMTETLAAFLAILALWCLARFDRSRSWFNAALAGGAMGLAVLCRPTFLPWLGLVSLAMLLVRGTNSEFSIQKSERRWLRDLSWRFANVSGLLITAAAVMSPWAIRNYRVFGKPIVTTTHGGYTFYLANNERFYEWLNHDVTQLPWDSKDFDQDWSLHLIVAALANEFSPTEHPDVGQDRLGYEWGWKDITKQPTMFLRACLFRLRQLWSPLPHKLTADESAGRQLLRYATCAWYCGVYALALAGALRLRWRLLRPPWIWGPLLCLAFTAVHTFYWTNLRMRAPLVPVVALVAAAGAIEFRSFFRRTRK